MLDSPEDLGSECRPLQVSHLYHPEPGVAILDSEPPVMNSLDLCGSLAGVSGDRQDGGEETGTFQEKERLVCGKGENGQIRPCGEVAQAKEATMWGPAQPSLKHLCCVLPQPREHRPGPRQKSRSKRGQMVFKEVWHHPASCLLSCKLSLQATSGPLWVSAALVFHNYPMA